MIYTMSIMRAYNQPPPHTGDKDMTYGIKKETANPSKPAILINSGEYMSCRYVGGPGGLLAKQWKTRKGAERVATRRGGEVFEITDILNY